MAERETPETEVTLSTGKLLGIFLGLVVICAIFFSLGYVFGHGSSPSTTTEVIPNASTGGNPGPKPSAGNKRPDTSTLSDFHCVTRWSRFDNHWQGVPFREVLQLVKPKSNASHVLVHAEQGFTANVPLTDLDRDEVLLATHHDGDPLTPDHGYPVRLIVPHLYAWKSVKWLRGLEFLDHDVAGFWEQNGYHMYGDPFKEQRFSE